MSSRDKVKQVLINEFFDPITMGVLGGAALGAIGLYTGAKKGTGARWRALQHIKQGTSIGSNAIARMTVSQNLEDTEKWHRKIAEKYGPNVKYGDYTNALHQHDAIHAIAPDRQSLIKQHEDLMKVRDTLIEPLGKGMDRKRAVVSAGKNPATELFDPAQPHLGTVEQHLHRHNPQNLDIHGNPLQPDPTTGVIDPKQSLFHALQSVNDVYRDPLGMTHKIGNRDLTVSDVISMTPLEKLDASNPEAARFRQKVTQSIIAPKQRLISKVEPMIVSRDQQLAQHKAAMAADRSQQSQDLEFSRASIPSMLEPGIPMRQRASRFVKKLLRNRVTDTIRSNIG